MKFGKQLEEYEVPEWKGHYIPYNELKYALEKIKHVPSTPLVTPEGKDDRRDSKKDSLLDRQDSERSMPGDDLQQALARAIFDAKGEAAQQEVWMKYVEREGRRVGDFVRRGLDGLEAQLKDLSKMAEGIQKDKQTRISVYEDEAIKKGLEAIKEDEPQKKPPNALVPSFLSRWYEHLFPGDGDDVETGTASAPTTREEEYMELRVLESIGRVSEGSQNLQRFTEMNHAALYKILKKHDKLLKTKDGLSNRFPALVAQSGLGDKTRFEELEKNLRDLSCLNSGLEGLDDLASAEVARLAAGLTAGPASQGGASQFALVVSFFLGTSVALFLSVGVLLCLPEDDPDTFSLSYFLTPMPVFRVVFSVLLCLWCIGTVMSTCDRYDINHNFIMNVDPRCRVKPEWFFSRAAGLTTIWILIFGMYVVDYKWRVVPTIWSTWGYNLRSSGHFVLYPITLLLVTFLGMLWPSRICRNRYKVSVMGCVWRTLLAPSYVVYFHDNIVGDILTSLAKPLQDVPAAVCYLASPHPQEMYYVQRFHEKGDTCGPFVHHVIIPLIGGLPYVLRALQCLRRYSDTKEPRNLYNFGKYLCSLLVVLVTSWNATHNQILIVFFVSFCATSYSAVWDVFIDWGLSKKVMFPDKTSMLPGKSSAASLPGGGSKASIGDGDEGAESKQERALSKRAYWACCFFDIIARFMWALTLMPITIISRSIVGRVGLVSIISSIEILRRSMWAVIRIENEQLHNASGFRALLWVPTKLGLEKKKRASKRKIQQL